MAGEEAGGGLVALPTAMTQSGRPSNRVLKLPNLGLLLGLFTLILLTILFTYTAHILGQCWVILQKRWPEYHSNCRKPYAEMSYRAVGQKFRYFKKIRNLLVDCKLIFRYFFKKISIFS